MFRKEPEKLGKLPKSCPECQGCALQRRSWQSRTPAKRTFQFDWNHENNTLRKIVITICNNTSPGAKASPSLIFQHVIVPSVINGDMAGIIMTCRFNDPWMAYNNDDQHKLPNQPVLSDSHRFLISPHATRICAAETFDSTKGGMPFSENCSW